MTYRAADRTQLVDFVDSVRRVFETPTQVGTRSFRVTASIGVAIYPEDGETPSQLLKTRMPRCIWPRPPAATPRAILTVAIARAADHALLIEEALGPATTTANSSFTSSRNCRRRQAPGLRRGAAALEPWWPRPADARRVHSGRREPASDHSTRPWVLDSAMTQLVRWRTAGWHDARVAVNLVKQPVPLAGFCRFGTGGAAAPRPYWRQPELELTERMVMGHDPAMQVALTRLRDAGITLAIDDFGTGFRRCRGCARCQWKRSRLIRALSASCQPRPVRWPSSTPSSSWPTDLP